MLELPQFVTTFNDRHGRPHYRFRRAGYSRYLPRPSEREAFEREYSSCLAEAPPTPIRSPRSAVGQLRALLQRHGWDDRGGFVYFVGTKRMVKIGWSSAIIMRIRQLTAQTPTRLRLLAAMPGSTELERRLHERFANDRIKGEWFQSTGALRALASEIAKTGTFVDIG